MHMTSIFLCSVQGNLKRCAAIEKNSAEESRLVGVDEIMSMKERARRLFGAIGNDGLT
jgi:hypothetical protein